MSSAFILTGAGHVGIRHITVLKNAKLLKNPHYTHPPGFLRAAAKRIPFFVNLGDGAFEHLQLGAQQTNHVV